jgi:EEF1A lysine methyltransferase 1
MIEVDPLINTRPAGFYALQDSCLRKTSKVLDLDEQWQGNACFLQYDFHEPNNIPSELHHTFDGVLIDPPFVTQDAWQQYAVTAKLLLAPGGKIICTTISENAGLLQALLGVVATPFKPSIPNLVYQYNLFCNFEPVVLCQKNPEISD